jgi:hypothetical protein
VRHRIQSLRSLTLLSLTVSAMVSAPAAASATSRTLAVQIVESTPLVPTRVSYQWSGKGLEVEGRIEKRRDRYGRIVGHVEIELMDDQDRLLSRHSAALQRFSPRRKDPDWASFRALIESVPSETAQLRICHSVGARRCPP